METNKAWRKQKHYIIRHNIRHMHNHKLFFFFFLSCENLSTLECEWITKILEMKQNTHKPTHTRKEKLKRQTITTFKTRKKREREEKKMQEK